MTKIKKRLLASLLALAMTVVMAVPSFAASYSVGLNYRFHVGDTATFLNLTGSVGTSLYCRKLSLYRTSAPGTDQTFTRVYVNNGTKRGYYLGQRSGSQWYMINKSNTAYSNGYDAIMWPVNAQNYETNTDSLFNLPSNNNSLKLTYKGYYLTSASAATGAKVYFYTRSNYNWYYYAV